MEICFHKPWLSSDICNDSSRLVQPGLPKVLRSSAPRSFGIFIISRRLSSQKLSTILCSGLIFRRILKISLQSVSTREEFSGKAFHVLSIPRLSKRINSFILDFGIGQCCDMKTSSILHINEPFWVCQKLQHVCASVHLRGGKYLMVSIMLPS